MCQYTWKAPLSFPAGAQAAVGVLPVADTHCFPPASIISKNKYHKQHTKCKYYCNIKTNTQNTNTGMIALPTLETHAHIHANTTSKPIPIHIALNETAFNSVFASPCETLQRNCKKEQGRCRTVLQVQVLGHYMTEQGLHKRVQGGPRTLQSRPQKSSSQRPCL